MGIKSRTFYVILHIENQISGTVISRLSYTSCQAEVIQQVTIMFVKTSLFCGADIDISVERYPLPIS